MELEAISGDAALGMDEVEKSDPGYLDEPALAPGVRPHEPTDRLVQTVYSSHTQGREFQQSSCGVSRQGR
jgi:hypothetical protein